MRYFKIINTVLKSDNAPWSKLSEKLKNGIKLLVDQFFSYWLPYAKYCLVNNSRAAWRTRILIPFLVAQTIGSVIPGYVYHISKTCCLFSRSTRNMLNVGFGCSFSLNKTNAGLSLHHRCWKVPCILPTTKFLLIYLPTGNFLLIGYMENCGIYSIVPINTLARIMDIPENNWDTKLVTTMLLISLWFLMLQRIVTLVGYRSIEQ